MIVRLADEAREIRAVLRARRGRTCRPVRCARRRSSSAGSTPAAAPRSASCRAATSRAAAATSAPTPTACGRVPVAEVKAQMRPLRAWLGPAGNLQLTDGEVTLRPEAELVELHRPRARDRARPDAHDARRDLPAKARSARAPDERRRADARSRSTSTRRCAAGATAMRRRRARPTSIRLRDEFADMIRTARRRTGRRLEAASTVTVTRENLDGVPGIVRFVPAQRRRLQDGELPAARGGRTHRPGARGA